jgi:hypothetical protein
MDVFLIKRKLLNLSENILTKILFIAIIDIGWTTTFTFEYSFFALRTFESSVSEIFYFLEAYSVTGFTIDPYSFTDFSKTITRSKSPSKRQSPSTSQSFITPTQSTSMSPPPIQEKALSKTAQLSKGAIATIVIVPIVVILIAGISLYNFCTNSFPKMKLYASTVNETDYSETALNRI